MTCKKIQYKTIDDARIALTKLILKKVNVKAIYKCQICGFFHLTHIPYKAHNAVIRQLEKTRRKNLIQTNEKIQNQFIQEESEYWERKFGIE